MNTYVPLNLKHPITQRLSSELIAAGAWIDQRGWCPATGGNFSARLALPEHLIADQTPNQISNQTSHLDSKELQDPCCLVTASGVHKGALTEDDLLEVDWGGQPLASDLKTRPSAETLVHIALYRLAPEIGAVLHAHSVPNTVLSLIEPGERLEINGFEMQKSLQGQKSHLSPTTIEIFDNTQDMVALAREVEERWQRRGGLSWALLVRGHGIYTWGRDVAEARRHLEGTEFMLSCLLELRRIGSLASPALQMPS